MSGKKSFVLPFVFILMLLGGTFGSRAVQPARAATLIVTNTNDGGAGSLRQAIADAVSGETITFQSPLAGQTIILSSTLSVSKNVTIDGSALASPISISGNNNVQVFSVNSGVTFTLNGLIIKNGKTTGFGGAIHNNGGTLTITNSVISGNSTVYDPNIIGVGYGGAIYSQAGTLIISDSTFNDNVGSVGGAIYCVNGMMTISNSTFLSNSASSAEGYGGAIYSTCGSKSEISNSTFSTNTAADHGGALFVDTDSTPFVVFNSTFYSNTAFRGGGILNAGQLIVTNSTFSHNNASDAGAIRNGLGGVLSLRNSILANTAGGVDCSTSDSATISANINNLIETTGTNLNSCGTALLTGDPVLGPLASNGGLTQTMALQSGSPAIDTAAGGYCPATDQRGVARPQGNGCDIGAFEYVTTNVTPTATPPYSYQPLYLSLTGSQTIGGVSAADEDILRFDGQTWSLFFDGSDVGLGAVDLFAFSVADASTIMMSVSASVTVQGIPVTPQDILLFQATSLGSNTAGTFSMMFDGSDVGLTTTDERIDSVSFLPDRRILISTTGSPAVTGISTGRDEDVLAFLPVTLGDATSGTWSMYFDGSDVGLADTSGEDVDALDVQGGNVYLSTTDNFSVSGLSGADEDVFICASTSVGDTTSCNYSPSLYFDGSTWGLSANDVDAINLLTSGAIPTAVPTNTPTPTLSPTPTPSPPMAAFDVKILSHEPNPSNAGQTVTVTVSVTDFGGGPAGSQLVTIVSDEGSTSCTTSQTTSTCSGQLTFNNPYGHLIRASVGGSYAEVDHYVNPPVTGTLTYTPTPTATPGGTNAMFADGFESGTLSAWTSSSTDAGDLSVSPAAALVGGQGLQAVIDDVNVLSLTSDHPNAEPHYLAGFYFDPNSITMANGDAHIILRGYSGSSTVALRMEFGYSAVGYQLRTGLVNDGTTWTETSWFTLSDAPHLIQVDWRAASGAGTNNGGLVLWIDGVQSQLLPGIDNDTRRIDRVLLGALAGVDTGTHGTYYFDAFESQR